MAPTDAVRGEAPGLDHHDEWPGPIARRTLLAASSSLGAGAVTLGAARLMAATARAQAAPPPGTPTLLRSAPANPAGVAMGAALAADNALRIPPLLEPTASNGAKTFNLTLQRGQSQFVPDRTAATLGINGAYLSPTLRAKQGDTVAMAVTNRIGETTTLHWHGMHLPAAMDGGPHQIIASNATWTPRFTIRQQAATLWFHAHLMGATQQQVTRGLAGMFIIDDDNPAQRALPHTYGVDDVPLILQEYVFGGRGQPGGGQPGTGNPPPTPPPAGQPGGGQAGAAVPILVNGSIAPTFSTTAPRVRLRLLNASSQRFFTLGFAGDRTFHQVASDGGLLAAPLPLTRLQLGPAERVEIVVDLTGDQPVLLQSVRNGGGAAATPVLSITSTAGTAETRDLAPLPAQLNVIDRLDPSTAAVTRDMILGGGGGGGQRTINGHSMTSMADMHDMTSTVRVRLGDTELWNAVNRTRQTHIFHVHDVQFQIVDRSRGRVAPAEMGRKDTIVVPGGDTVRIMMRFADYADPETPYMFHCHILQHEDQGMMGQFVVMPA